MAITETTATTAAQKPMRRPLFSRTVLRWFTLSTSPLRLMLGGIFTVLSVLLVALHAPAYLDPEVTQGTLLFVLSFIACGIMGALTCFRWGMTKPLAGDCVSVAMAILLPIVAMTMVECLNNVFIWDWSPQTLMLNYILYWVFYGIIYVFTGSLRWPMLIVNSLVFILGMVNYYVVMFRGTPFVPMDLLALGTAAKVAAGYDYSLSYRQVISLLLLAFLIIAALKIRTPRMDLIGKVATRVFFGTLSVCIICIYSFTNLYADAGLKPDFWNQARSYRKTGVVMNFCINTKYLFVSEPDDYDAEQVDDIVYDTIGNESVDNLGLTAPTNKQEKAPNIICIMNESLADLSVLGDVQTNIDYMPYLNSLTENTIRGNLSVSIIGGGTSNSEFEFLTGTPLSFFPLGSNAYSLYIKNATQTLVSTLKKQNYSATAFHPYYASGWNRISVYNHFGFEQFLSLSSVIPNDILQQYSAGGNSTEHLIDMVEDLYPGQSVLMRQYVSDSYNYQEVIRQYENRDPSKPFFLFNVTMQNHGGYTTTASNFDPEVYVTDVPGGYDGDVTTAFPKTNQYLSLIKYSDEAFAELIAYFEQQEEPTIICMFGDHLPGIEEDYVKALLGVENLYDTTIEQEQKRYMTPFYIWANYDIPEQTIPHLSANYLSSYVLKTAGVELPAYNQYLLKLSETLPVINAIGTMDAEGNCYKSGSSPYEDLLAEYEKVMYNHLFDQDNRQSALFDPE